MPAVPLKSYIYVFPRPPLYAYADRGTTLSQILSSPAAMKRLRGAVSGRMAYILPGMVGDEEVRGTVGRLGSGR